MAGDIPGLPDKAAAWFDAAFRPFHDFYLWCQTVDDRIRAGGAALDDFEESVGAITLTEPYAHTQLKVADGVYFLMVAPFDGEISSTVTDCSSGTCAARWTINGTYVGTANNAVSTTRDTVTHTDPNRVFVAGDLIGYEIFSNATCLKALLQANITRALVP